MRALEIKKDKYIVGLVRMMYEWSQKEEKEHFFSEFIAEMLKYSTNGAVLRPEIRPILKEKFGLSEIYFKQIINRLRDRGDIVAKVGHAYYLHPKYRAITECDGVFVITIKDE